MEKTTLFQLHALAVALHLTSGILGVIFIQDGTPVVDIVAPLFEFVTNAKPEEPFFRPKPKTIFSVAILTPLVAVEFITAFFHVVYILALKFEKVQAAIDYVVKTPGANALRWIEYGITATLLSTFGNVAIGITDYYFFLRSLACGISLQGLGYLIEKLDDIKDRELAETLNRGLFWFQGLLNLLPFVGILLYQTFASTTYDAYPMFVQNTVPLALWYMTFAVINQLSFRKVNQFADPFYTEKWYILLSISTKITIFWAEFATFKSITEDNGFSTASGLNWDVVRYMALSFPAAIVVGIAFTDYRAWVFLNYGLQ